MKKVQLAKEIYLKNLDIMKKVLDLISFKMDRRTKDFQYARSQIMDFFYNNLRKLFKSLEDDKIIQKCPKNHNLRQGYKDCDCGGSGYINYK